MNRVRKLFREAVVLERSVPGIVLALFIVCVVAMNLLANKSINLYLSFSWPLQDCGIIFSWAIFLFMDVITKRFGARAATILSITAYIFNLLVVFLFFVAAHIPGVWSSAYVEGSEEVINTALNEVFAGSWYVVFGSSVAFTVSAFVNNYLNEAIGKHRDKNDFKSFARRSYISTAVGQFCDNMIFALIVSWPFFGWSPLQCFSCAMFATVVEFVSEVVFSPVGYRILRSWQKDGVGSEYLREYGIAQN